MHLINPLVSIAHSRSLLISVHHPIYMSSDGSFGRVALKVGPYGGTGGDTWDDGVYSTVRVVDIVHDSACVFGIQTKYKSAGDESIWSEFHGPKRADYNKSISSVRLDDPDEFLVAIFGRHVSDWFTPTHIASLTFKSNKSVYGPFGLQYPFVVNNFAIHVPGYKIVGLHGRFDKWFWFRAIGAYLQPIHHQVPPTKSTYVNVSSNEISGTVGNKIGNFSVANKYRVVNNIYNNTSAQPTPDHDSSVETGE
ncbi:jacalin-related lectin 19 isoform X2 [Rosa chinensis]|uniref:jacalin-related lectin 19 isoform X2 n=1 Tax=Rosa chinensis TaxID=74649 RepID=UPI000D094055|nr:jacalin-related lectin 19 isoform X2 [Rosa chinensis]